MSDASVVHNTFTIEREYPVPPERVFAALADPAKKRRWFADGDHQVLDDFELDFRVGGLERLQYHFREGTPFAGVVIAHDGTILDLVADQRLVSSQSMRFAGQCISAALVTYVLQPTMRGTTLVFTHQAAFFAGADGPQIREAGWRSLFERLANELTAAS
jgi:uncharacterized protein YndB with AHSA1/START domain